MHPTRIPIFIALFVLSLAANGGGSTSKQAQDYCLKNSPDDYGACLKHRYRYLEARQKLIMRHREDRHNCRALAQQQLNEGSNRCWNAGNSGRVSGPSGSISAGVSRELDCDPTSNRERDATATNSSSRRADQFGKGGTLQKSQIEKKCMAERGWENARTARRELRLLSREYGFEKEEYDQ